MQVSEAATEIKQLYFDLQSHGWVARYVSGDISS
jgi:hypothetical protein